MYAWRDRSDYYGSRVRSSTYSGIVRAVDLSDVTACSVPPFHAITWRSRRADVRMAPPQVVVLAGACSPPFIVGRVTIHHATVL